MAGNDPGDKTTIGVLNEDEKEPEAAKDIAGKLTDARGRLHTDEYSQDAVSAARGVIRELVAQESQDKQLEDNSHIEPTPYPLKIGVTLDGIEGFKFGDAITSKFLPKRYRKPAGEARIVFTLTEFTHKFAGNDWTTELGCLCRLLK